MHQNTVSMNCELSALTDLPQKSKVQNSQGNNGLNLILTIQSTL